MSSRSGREVHGLALLTLESFIASFLIARAFTTLAGLLLRRRRPTGSPSKP